MRARASWVLNAWLSGVQGQLGELKLLAGHSNIKRGWLSKEGFGGGNVAEDVLSHKNRVGNLR